MRPRSLRNWQTVLMNEKPGSYTSALYATNGSSQGKINGWVGDVGLYAQPIATDRWTHLTLTFDGTTAREYVDGSLVATRPSPAAPSGPGPLRLGGNRVWSSETLDGLLDDVRIYDRALSAADIATDMATGLPGRSRRRLHRLHRLHRPLRLRLHLRTASSRRLTSRRRPGQRRPTAPGAATTERSPARYARSTGTVERP